MGGIRRLEHRKPPTPDMLLGVLQLWDTQKWIMLLNLEGHRSMVNSGALSANGKLALSASFDTDLVTREGKHVIKLWDLQKGKLLRDYEFPEKSNIQLCFSKDDKNGSFLWENL